MKTIAELRAALAERKLPGVPFSWLDLLEQCALEHGATLLGALDGSRHPSAVKTRQRAWAGLRCGSALMRAVA